MSDDAALASSGLKPGDVLARKYRFERVLGQGGMGLVVLAHHLQLDEKVALKFLLPGAAQNAEAVGRFAREARAAAKIKSEHVARVVDVGELENGSPFLVMEYLEGGDLGDRLKEQGPFGVEQAVDLVLQACEALAEAHAMGIVHRDLKPANLFLAERPNGSPIVKVLDFGISKAAPTASLPQLTKTAAVMGSPLYMSPEQMQSAKAVDPRSDIWALGIVLYELVSGKAPFQGDTMPELIVAILQRQQDGLDVLRSDVPPAFAAIVNRCLAKDPAARYPDVGALALALAPFGPPRSDVSVERIRHVLAPPSGGPARVVVVSPSGAPVSADAGTQLDPSSLPSGSRKGTPDGSRPAPYGSTTAKPVSNEEPLVPSSSPSGARRPAVPAWVWAAVLVLTGFLAWRSLSPASTALPSTPSAPASAAAAPASVPPPLVSATPPASSAPTDVSAPSQATASAPVQSSSVSLLPVPARPERRSVRKPPSPPDHPSASTPPSAKPSCDPPYIINPAGHVEYKRECLGKN